MRSLMQEDKSPKKVFVLGVYASAVHAKWINNGQTICQALAVSSEPRIFWDGNQQEAKEIIDKIIIPKELGELIPASKHLNGPSAKVLDENILAPLGYTRQDAWLCDCLPEARLNPNQTKVIEKHYNPLFETYSLNKVTVPKRPSVFCDDKRIAEITTELMQSAAELIVLLGDIPISQYLKRVSDIPYSTLQEYSDLYGYGIESDITINGISFKVLPLAHPRQIGALGPYSDKWKQAHALWEHLRLGI